MPITQDRMINLIDSAFAVVEQMDLQRDIARALIEERDTSPNSPWGRARYLVKGLPSAENQGEIFALMQGLLVNLIDRILDDRVPKEAYANLVLERTHFAKRREINSTAAQRLQRTRNGDLSPERRTLDALLGAISTLPQASD